MVHPPGREDDRGSATLQLVAVFPAFLLIVLLVVQAALIWHARNIAEAAAQEGLRSARLFDGSRSAGQVTARSFLEQTSGDLLSAPSITVERDDRRARVEVRGQALSLLPGIRPQVEAVAAGPVERFVPGP
jgi:Flp pilus assembly protein TadG